jgi:hypothetical protein
MILAIRRDSARSWLRGDSFPFEQIRTKNGPADVRGRPNRPVSEKNTTENGLAFRNGCYCRTEPASQPSQDALWLYPPYKGLVLIRIASNHLPTHSSLRRCISTELPINTCLRERMTLALCLSWIAVNSVIAVTRTRYCLRSKTASLLRMQNFDISPRQTTARCAIGRSFYSRASPQPSPAARPPQGSYIMCLLRQRPVLLGTDAGTMFAVSALMHACENDPRSAFATNSVPATRPFANSTTIALTPCC